MWTRASFYLAEAKFDSKLTEMPVIKQTSMQCLQVYGIYTGLF